jgi:hydroxymethylpyrimidine pyrophosphatase-like HAD family hydrolase
MDKRIIIADLDGTLSDYQHRVQFYIKKDYDQFNSKGRYDKPIENICNILRGLHDDETEVVILTARDDWHYQDTAEWLKWNDIPFDRLIMRPTGDRSYDDDCKKDLFEKHIKKENVWFVLEDRKMVVDMWRNQGLTCLQVASGDF